MNRVNPLYIGLFLVFILAFSVFKLSSAKEELEEAKLSLAKTTQIANELSSIKLAYNNKKRLEKSLRKTLRNNVLKNASITTQFKNAKVKLSSDSIDKKALNFLMSKILNATYNVDILEIKKLSDDKASFYMEIKW